ncbi:MFS transporter [Caulobacter mirabilis]|nr:MFS transporter [Caulobacter mirabilis]
MASTSATGSDPELPVWTARNIAVLALLTSAYALNFMDRYALVAMAAPIKSELRLTDGELGLLFGLAFSLVHAACSIPMAMLADRWGHARVMALSLAFWAGMTLLASRASGFLPLAATRAGVGVGEAGGTPPAHAILSGLFKGRTLPIALAIYSTGSGIGLTLGLSLGALMAAAVGWRTSLIIIAIPGFILAPLIWLVVPRNRDAAGHRPRPQARRRFGDLGFTFYTLALAMGSAAVAGFSALAWLPSIASRSYGDAGAALGVAIGLSNMVGILCGGFLAAFIEKRTTFTLRQFCVLASLVAGLMLVSASLAANASLFIAFSAALVFSHSMMLAPVLTQAQRLVAPEHKALASAIVLLGIGLLGAGLGPLLVGWISDRLAASGPRALNHALAIISAAYLPAAVLFFQRSKEVDAGHAR